MALSTDHQDNDRKLGAVVARALAHSEISRREASKRTDIPYTTFRRLLDGHASFKFSQLETVADILGVTVSSLTAQAEGVAA